MSDTAWDRMTAVMARLERLYSPSEALGWFTLPHAAIDGRSALDAIEAENQGDYLALLQSLDALVDSAAA